MLSPKGFPGIHGEHQWQPAPPPPPPPGSSAYFRGFHQAGISALGGLPPSADGFTDRLPLLTFSSPGEEMAAHSSTLAWRIPWTEECDHGVTKSDTTERLSTHAGSGLPLPHLQDPCGQGFTSECTISLVSPLFGVHPTPCPRELHLTLSCDPRRASLCLSSHPMQTSDPCRTAQHPQNWVWWAVMGTGSPQMRVSLRS